MSDSTRAALAGSLAAGYLLGRSRRAKLALAVASYLVSNKLRAKPQDLLATAAGRLSDSPQLSQLTDQVRGELLSVGREALKAVADRRLGAFADSLAERTKSLSEAMDNVAEELSEDTAEEEKGPEEESEGAQTEAEEPEEPEEAEEPEEERESRPKRAESGKPDRPRRETAKRSGPAKKSAKNAPPGKAAKSTAKRKATEQQSGRR